jgi:uncharacterized protein (TIGR03435 family)
MTEKDDVRIAGPAKLRTTLHLLMGVTLALSQVTNPQLYGQNSAAPTNQGAPRKPAVEEFEVATIKPAAPDLDGYRHLSLSIALGGRVHVTNWTLKQLICAAYNLSYWQVSGGEAWIEKDYYDVEAKPPDPSDGTPGYSILHDNWHLDDPNLRTMLQALLKDRFQLKTHLVAKDGPVHILERGDGELSLTPNKHPLRDGALGGIGIRSGAGYVLLDTTMSQFAGYLSDIIFHETVIDKTGLEGSYDFRSKALVSDEDRLDPGLMLPAVKEMGLKLTRSTGPVTILVVDQAARPSPN